MTAAADTGAVPSSLDFLVDRGNFTRARFRSPSLAPGPEYAIVAVERFALSANNITYALLGDRVGYWDFFPGEAEWGRIPAWGFGRVISGGASALVPGERLYGYFPMSTHLVMAPGKLDPEGFYDAIEHRAHLSPVYNYYARVTSAPGFDASWANEHMLLRPVFYASFLVHDLLSEAAPAGADSLIVTSASSKAAIGLAYLISRQGGPNVIGLTSEAHLDFVRGLGVYYDVFAYGDLSGLARGRAAIVDFSGNASLLSRLDAELEESALLYCHVGYTHAHPRLSVGESDPRHVSFFAPDRLRKRVREWGFREFQRRFDEAYRAYAEFSRNWLHIVESFGPDEVASGFAAVAQNRTRPDQGRVLSLWPSAPAE